MDGFSYTLRHCLGLILLTILSGCKPSESAAREIDSRLETVTGDGSVERTALTYSFLKSGNKDSLVDFGNYGIPADAAFPSNTFEGRLTLLDLDTSGRFREIKDSFSYTDSTDTARMHLPGFDYEFVQTGSYIIPLKRGYLLNEHPTWEYILEPGRVWDEKKDNGFSRAAIPFTLKQKNQNCVHNGVLMFLFKDDGTTTSVSYQIASETCAYFKFDMWGTVKAAYTAYSIDSKTKYVKEYVSEVSNRMPMRPMAELTEDYPNAQPLQFSAPKEVTKEDMTLYGFVIDGTNYVGGCETRYGTYPFCEVLVLPSYSTAKSISAGMGLMRMEKLFPGSSKMHIGNLISDCKKNGNWTDVTLENALDMATGNYESSELVKDEGARHTQKFFLSENHKGKIDYSCSHYARKSAPGTQFVYHTSDTYILGTAMNSHLRSTTGNPKADYFTDLIAEDILKPLGTSPTNRKTQRTYAKESQPFSGYGLFYHHDDVAKIAKFLNNGAQINSTEMLDGAMYASIMNADKNTGLKATDTKRYDNGFWLVGLEEFENRCDFDLIPTLDGYGGIKIYLLPNDTVYYFFSDNYEYNGIEGIRESDRIRPFCQE